MSSHSGEESAIKLGFFLVVIGAGVLASGVKRMRQNRKIEDTPCSDIQSAAQGLVEIQGHALPSIGRGYVCLSGDACVFRDVLIEKYVKSGKNGSWVKVFDEREGSDFIVSDGTGMARVLTESAEFVVEEKITQWTKFDPEMRERAIARYGMIVPDLSDETSLFGFTSRRSIRFTEKVIRIAAPVYARGYFQTIQEMKPFVLEPLYYRFLGRLAELRKQPGWKRKAFDLDRDGKITEFEIAKGSEKLLYLSKGEIKPDDHPEPVALQGLIRFVPEHGLLIGDSYQEALIQRLRSMNILRVVGGAALVAAGVGTLTSTFWH